MSFFRSTATHMKACKRQHPDSPARTAACVVSHPGKLLLAPFLVLFHHRYHEKKLRPKLRFSIDMLILGVLIGITSAVAIGYLSSSARFARNIVADASIAPAPLVAGSGSTISFRYTNQTGETLSNAQLRVEIPAGFVLQDDTLAPSDDQSVLVDLGTIDIDEIGSTKIRGVFLGTEETHVSTTLTFRRPEKNRTGEKTTEFSFVAETSALTATLDLPDRFVAGQPIEGRIRWSYGGDLSLPGLRLALAVPDTFTLTDPTTTGIFDIDGLAPNTSGELSFRGFFTDPEQEEVFHLTPFVLAGGTQFAQLTQTVRIEQIPPQLSVTHTIDGPLYPGSTNPVTITWKHIGDTPVHNVSFNVAAPHPFFGSSTTATRSPETIEPGTSGTATVSLIVRPTPVGTTEDLARMETRIQTNYTIKDGVDQRVQAQNGPVDVLVATPASVRTFGRYHMPSGDQIGRGPTPPIVGERTTYWIFWSIKDTISPLTGTRVTGTLAPSVQFTGRQSVSGGAPIVFDPQTREVFWQIPETIHPSEKTVGGAFEVAITPTPEQGGTSPLILTSTTLQSRDVRSGAFIQARGNTITLSDIDGYTVVNQPVFP